MLLTLLRIISGARYSGVPHSVHVRPLTRLANPKSVIYNNDMTANCHKGVGRGVRGVRTNPPLGDNKNKLTGILHV